MDILKVGDKRKFTFKDEDYEIKEIIDNPNITMWWSWQDSVCPYCKRQITRNMQHRFYRIEILLPVDKKNVDLDDFILLGFTYDNRIMLIPRDKTDVYLEVFNNSKKYKHFVNKIR